MNSLDPSFDLIALADELKRARRHPDLEKAIRRAFDVASAYQDLSEAEMALNLLSRLTTESSKNDSINDSDLTTIAGGLTTTAIVHYARATDTKPIQRKKWFGIDKLNSTDKVMHKEIMALRDKEVAHYGTGRFVDGEINIIETLTLCPTNHTNPIEFLSSRANNKSKFTSQFLLLLVNVREIAMEAISNRSMELINVLNEVLPVDSDTANFLWSRPLTDARLLYARANEDTDFQDFAHGRVFSKPAIIAVPGLQKWDRKGL